jgi:Asp-tRNA(Asn)/Glu-tRNA(Gln) amidotransferase A subunit family amidase
MSIIMNWAEWIRYDAMGLADLVRRREVTPGELAAQVAAGIAHVNPDIQAVIEVFEDVIEDPLKDGMNPEGVFAGVPYLMKDIGPTLKGRRQEMGSLLMQGHVTPTDSFLTRKIRDAGLNIIGRTTTSEFAMCASTENPTLYVSRNPWDLAYTAGGSSSGTAAIVAAGVIPISHASDGGGSIRGPAGINGTCGLKPSRGVFSAAPDGSDLTSIIAVQGCLSRTVRDTAGFLDACRGGAPGEFMPYWTPEKPSLELVRRDPPRLKIALSHEWGDYRATPYIAGELERAGRALEALGHHVEWRTPDVDFRAAYTAQTTCYITHAAASFARLFELKGHGQPTTRWIESMNFRIWEAGIHQPYAVRARMQMTLNQISRDFGRFFEDWDVLVTPVMTQATHKLGTVDFTTLNERDTVQQWYEKLWGLYPYLPLGNLCGTPGISIPMAAHEDGLPLGIQALSRQSNDGLLLQLAAQVERALDGEWNGGRRPAIHVTSL